MESKSLVVRAKNRLSRLVLPNVDCDESSCNENYDILDVLNDCFVLSFAVFFILVLACSIFNWPTFIVIVANIIPDVLLIDYLRRKDVSKSGRVIATLSLVANFFLAASLATGRWDWFMGFF